MSLLHSLRENLKLRPAWMSGLLLFCAFMTFIYLPWDIFLKPVSEDQEVWFGYMFTGWAAKATAIPHWLVYGAGAWGFWRMKSWMHPWASLYVLQIAIGMFVWSFLNDGSSEPLVSALIALPFIILAIFLFVGVMYILKLKTIKKLFNYIINVQLLNQNHLGCLTMDQQQPFILISNWHNVIIK